MHKPCEIGKGVANTVGKRICTKQLAHLPALSYLGMRYVGGQHNGQARDWISEKRPKEYKEAQNGGEQLASAAEHYVFACLESV